MNGIKNLFKKQWVIIKNEFTSEPPKKLLINSAKIFIGAIIVAFGTAFFLLPMNIVSGGVSSLAIIFNAIPGMNAISTNIYIVLINWIFFAIGLFTLGLKYSLKTIIFTIAEPLTVILFSWIIDTVVVDGHHILDITNIADIQLANGVIQAEGSDSLLALVYFVAGVLGGLVIGAGIGLALLGGGSSGGTDVFNLLMHKYFHIKVGTASLICDSLIIFGGFFVNGYNLLASMVGIISAILCSFMIDKVFLGSDQYFVALIVSKKWRQLNDYINSTVQRGTTLIQAQGGFTGVDTVLLEVCFDKRDYNLLQQIINQIDANAFVTVLRATEIVGYGFSRDTPKSNMMDIALPPDEARKIIIQAKKQEEKKEREEVINKGDGDKDNNDRFTDK